MLGEVWLPVSVLLVLGEVQTGCAGLRLWSDLESVRDCLKGMKHRQLPSSSGLLMLSQAYIAAHTSDTRMLGKQFRERVLV